MQHDAREISRRLAVMAPQLCADLFPAGRREGGEFCVGSIAGEQGRSLRVRLFGDRAGLWIDHADDVQRGDMLDLIAAVQFRGDIGAALAWGRRWLGLDDPKKPAPAPAPIAARAPDAERERDIARRRNAAQSLFNSAAEHLAGTPAEAYLRARGIDLAALGRQPASLRFHPALRNAEAAADLPALVAAVADAAGRFVAVHRTWLAKDAADIWRKAPLQTPKMSLGAVAGGCIHLWRGASGTPLAQAVPDDVLLIGEGIETTLSAIVAAPDLRAVAAVSLGNMGRIMLPAAVRNVVLLGENDAAAGARRAIEWAARNLAAQGRTVRIARPPPGFKDLNDLLVGAEAAP